MIWLWRTCADLVCGLQNCDIRTNDIQCFRRHAGTDNIVCLTFYNRMLIASRHIEYFLYAEKKEEKKRENHIHEYACP